MILIVSAIFPPEPVVSANMSFDIATALSYENEVIVLSPYPTRPFGKAYNKDEIYKNYPFKHIILDSYTCPKSSLFGRFKESYSLGIHTKKFIEKNHNNIEIIYANTWPLFAQKYLVQTAKVYNIPVVLHIQDIYPESISNKIPIMGSLVQKIFLNMDKNTTNDSSKIVTISYKMKDYLIKSRNIKEKKIDVVRNWQDDDIFINQKNSTIENDMFTFMYLGSINPTAGVDFLIHAFAKANLKESKLIIVGNGSDKKKCIEIAKTYHNKNIEFYEVSRKEVPNMQAKADILMLPLKKGIAKTALPSKLTAYMLSSKPIIASIDVDSEPAQMIQDSGCGFVIEPENEKKLIKCMKEVVKIDKHKLLIMGEKSFIYAKENLSKERNLYKLTSIIRNNKRKIENA